MLLWLDASTPCRFPHYAHHYVGVGGAVVNEHLEILLIKEHRSADQRKWKLPGGYADPLESIKQAVQREVLEETGINCNFEGICAIREQIDHKFDMASDFYFCCACTPVRTEKQDALKVAIQDVKEV